MEEQPLNNPEISTVGLPLVSTGGRPRVNATIVLLVCGAVLAIAAWLKPDAHGYGTHRQLGFGKCGMLITTGYPCPTCGMTTAFAHTVRGQWVRAFMVQPAGFVLALGTMAGALGAIWVLITGRMPPIRCPLVTPYRLCLGLMVLLVGGWAFKIVMGLLDGSLPEH